MTTEISPISLEEMLSVDGCKVTADFHYLESPCGLRISKDLPIPGSLWPAMRWAHEQHHAKGHLSPFLLTQTVYSHEGTTTISCSCDCPR